MCHHSHTLVFKSLLTHNTHSYSTSVDIFSASLATRKNHDLRSATADTVPIPPTPAGSVITVARLAQRLLSSLEDYFAQLNPNL